MEEWVKMLILEIEDLKSELKAVQGCLVYADLWEEIDSLEGREHALSERIAGMTTQIEGDNPRILFPLIEKSKGKSRDEIIDLVIEAEGGFCLGVTGVPSLGSYAAELVDKLLVSNWVNLVGTKAPNRAWKRIKSEKPHSVVAFHGLSFLANDGDFSARAEMAMLCGEICVADEALSSIGLIVSGPVRTVFSRDCHSAYCPARGTRVSKPMEFEAVIHNPTQEEFDSISEKGFYCEGWMEPTKVLGVFLGEYAGFGEKMHARRIAEKYGVAIHIKDGDFKATDFGQ